MARSGEQSTYIEFTQIYKDSEMVGEIVGGEYTSIKGKKPTLKGDSEWEMRDELVSMGYEIVEITKRTRKKIKSSGDGFANLGVN